MSSKGLRRAPFISLALGLLLAGLTAACQTLPHPFQSEINPAVVDSLLEPGPHSGVFVRQIRAEPVALGAELRRTVVEALKARDIPAGVESANRRSFILFGGASARETSEAGVSEVTIRWELTDARGTMITAFEQTRRLPTEAWAGANPELIEGLAEGAAERVANLLEGLASGPREAAGDESDAPHLVLLPVEGAPGDGNPSLMVAMSEELRQASVEVQREVSEMALLLQGRVHVRDAGAGMKWVEIVWTLTRPDGEELGTVSQSGEVPEKSLASSWAGLARTVAANGVPGILDLLDRVGRAE